MEALGGETCGDPQVPSSGDMHWRFGGEAQVTERGRPGSIHYAAPNASETKRGHQDHGLAKIVSETKSEALPETSGEDL